MALDVTPAGAAADSYATLAEAAAFLALRSDPAATGFLAESAPVREEALREAARLLNAIRYHRRPYSSAYGKPVQALAFPREHHVDENGSPIVEAPVKRAQVEFAVTLVERFRDSAPILMSGTDLASMRALGLRSAKVGTAQLDFEGNAGAFGDPRIGRLAARGLPSSAAVLLASYVSSVGAITPDAEDLVRIGEVRLLERFRRPGPQEALRTDLIVL